MMDDFLKAAVFPTALIFVLFGAWILLLGLGITCHYQILKANLERTRGQSSQLLSCCKLV